MPVLIFLFMGARTWDEIERNILWLFEGQLIVTGLLAFALYLAGLILAGLAGSSLVKHWRKKSRSLAHRAAWTSLATLGIAMPGLWITTLLLGFAAHVAISPLLSAKPHTAFLNRVWRIDEDLPRPEFVEELLYKAAGSGFVVVIGTLAILAIVVVWTLGPSVASENLSQQDGVAKSSNRSQRLGSWVSRAYPAIGLTFMLLFVVGFIVMPTISLLVAFRVPVPGLASLPSASRTLLAGTAGALAASAVGLWALNTRLARVIEPLRPFIDVALDTDSYLWQFPREETPKALIAERFASLLRHLSLWRDDDGRGYRAIVFVAHSQGTVLTADTLAFLCREGNPHLPRASESTPPQPDLYFFTMGSPLRQLYSRTFPHLFWWVHGEPVEWAGEVKEASPSDKEPAADHAIPCDAFPKPSRLGVRKWVNAYYTGDYVGRALWPDRTGGVPFEAGVREDPDRMRRERCRGAGAHMHYWDEAAEAVGEELDTLINQA